MSEIESGEIIVLRQTPYKESDLIVSGISPEFGKLEIIAYRARKSGAKDFPVFDLFRHLHISFKAGVSGSELFTATELELVSPFTNLARKLEHLEFVSKIGQFLLKNSVNGSPLPLVFDTLRNVLDALSDSGVWTRQQCAVLIKLTFLYENGLLPEAERLSPSARAKITALYESLIECAVSGDQLPPLSDEYYKSLNSYLNGVITESQLYWK